MLAAPPRLGCHAPCSVASDSRLAQLRGGFDLGGGLQVAFGIDRMVDINGQTVARQQVHIPDLSRMSLPQAQALQRALAGIQVNLGAAGAAVSAGHGLSPGTTLVQNSLDAQAIRVLTVVNASTNSLQLLRSVNLAATLRDALTAPLGSR